MERMMKLREVLLKAMAKKISWAGPGPKGRNGAELTVSTPLILDRNHHNKSSKVLSVRLAQEKPAYLESLVRAPDSKSCSRSSALTRA
jgi:hypothetical protein